MKNITIDVDTLLIIISVGLLIAIFFNIAFGCSYRKSRENFDNKEEKKDDKDATSATPATPATPSTPATPATPSTSATPATPSTPATSATPATPATPAKKESFQPTITLSKFEQEIKEGLENGSINEDDIMKLIKQEKFTQQTVDNLSQYITQTLNSKNRP